MSCAATQAGMLALPEPYGWKRSYVNNAPPGCFLSWIAPGVQVVLALDWKSLMRCCVSGNFLTAGKIVRQFLDEQYRHADADRDAFHTVLNGFIIVLDAVPANPQGMPQSSSCKSHHDTSASDGSGIRHRPSLKRYQQDHTGTSR